MKPTSCIDLKNNLQHLYINPLEKCNLRCKICYTKKTADILSESQIINFIDRYRKEIDLQVITFCGGELFVLPYFTQLINNLCKQELYVQLITNGTIDRLNEINNPNSVNLIVSIDGLENYHDENRGDGNFKKSVSFIKKAIRLGFHAEIFSIVTKQSLKEIPLFEQFVKKELDNISITYHPRKPLTYLSQHPISNLNIQTKNFDFLDDMQTLKLMKNKNTFPSKNLGCYQISLMSDGKIYGCCEGFKPIGNINTSIKRLIEKLKENIKGPCLGCSQPEFICGIKQIVDKIHQ